MKRRQAEMFGTLLREFLRTEGVETPLNEHRLVAAWPEVMGQAIARYTGEVAVRGGVLYVQLKSPALRANLLMERTALVKRLNDHVGAQVIHDIVFR